MKLWTVADVMTADVAVAKADTPYREIVHSLTTRRVSAVPVIGDFARVLGVVSEADLLHKIETAGRPETRRLFEGRRRHAARTKATGAVARDLMTVPAITTMPHTLIPAAARLMDAQHVKRLPVVDDLGRLVGIVTRSDLLKVHLRPDADIHRDVVEGVLHRVLAVGEGIIRVAVRDGVVILIGELDRRSATITAVRLAEAVAGVVAVEDHLTSGIDDTALAINTAPGETRPFPLRAASWEGPAAVHRRSCDRVEAYHRGRIVSCDGGGGRR